MSNRMKPIPSGNLGNECVVIVGGGPAAQMCAETLRQRDDTPWRGRIVMLTGEETGPYDRTKLSKSLTSTAQDLLLRNSDFYDAADIELKTNSKVVSVDTSANQVVTESGETYGYDFLVLATGGTPRTIKVKGSDKANNVFSLRSPKDANEIAIRSEQKNVVIIGSSFIGMEVAAYLSSKAASVTVVGKSPTPFAGVLGDQVGKWVQNLHLSKGRLFFDVWLVYNTVALPAGRACS